MVGASEADNCSSVTERRAGGARFWPLSYLLTSDRRDVRLLHDSKYHYKRNLVRISYFFNHKHDSKQIEERYNEKSNFDDVTLIVCTHSEPFLREINPVCQRGLMASMGRLGPGHWSGSKPGHWIGLKPGHWICLKLRHWIGLKSRHWVDLKSGV